MIARWTSFTWANMKLDFCLIERKNTDYSFLVRISRSCPCKQIILSDCQFVVSSVVIQYVRSVGNNRTLKVKSGTRTISVSNGHKRMLYNAIRHKLVYCLINGHNTKHSISIIVEWRYVLNSLQRLFECVFAQFWFDLFDYFKKSICQLVLLKVKHA